MELSRLNELIETNVMKHSFTSSRWPVQSDHNNSMTLTHTADTVIPNTIGGNRGLPSSLTRSEFVDIDRCFKRANAKVEGYLDFEELQVFMELRRCPITDWEATKLLEYADSTYHYYISLEQIIELTTLYGIGTHHPIQMTRSEFDTAIKHAFRLTSSHTIELLTDDLIDFNGALNYFESKVAKERQEEEYETVVEEYQDNMVPENQNSVNDTEVEDIRESQNDPQSFETQQATVDEEPQQAVEFLTKKWESQIHEQRKQGLRNKSNRSPYSVVHSATKNANKNLHTNITNNLKSLSTNNVSTSREQEPPPVKSIYRRKNLLKQFSTNELISKSKTNESIYESTMADAIPSHTVDDIQIGSLNNFNKAVLPPPPLPSPIVPDYPTEWLSK